MSNGLQEFRFESSDVRIIEEENGQLLWVAKDVATIMGYSWNGTQCIDHVPEKWRGVRSVLTPSGTQEMACLTEQGLYFFLNRSDKPKALPFQEWVAEKVLPSIRKTGSYSLPVVDSIVNQSKSDLLLLAYNQALQLEEFQKREAAMNSECERLEAEAKKWIDMVSAYGLYTLALAAKAIYNTIPDKMGRSRLTAWLREKGYICKKGECEPYQKFIEQGLFRIQLEPYTDSKGKERIYARTYITQKGIDHIINKLKGIPENPLALAAPTPLASIEAPKTMNIDGVDIDIDEMLKNFK